MDSQSDQIFSVQDSQQQQQPNQAVNNEQIPESDQLYRKWEQHQINKLLQIRQQYPDTWVSKSMKQLNRSKISVCNIIHRLKKKKKKKKVRSKTFSEEQQKLLNQLYKQNPENWEKINSYFPDLNINQIRYKYLQVHNMNLKTTHAVFTTEQDQMLLATVIQFNYQWQQISKAMKKFTPIDCYSRYKKINDLRQVGSWSFQEECKLMDAYEKYFQDWQKIRDEVNPKKSHLRYRNRFIKYCKHYTCLNRWTEQEQKTLMNLAELHNKNWQLIHQFMNKYSLRQCYFKYYDKKRNEDKSHRRKIVFQELYKNKKYGYVDGKIGNWSIEDDNYLLKLAVKYQNQWDLICNKFYQKRNAENCRLRCLKLDQIYNIQQRKDWSRYEDILLQNLYEEYPNNWYYISKQFENCSEVQSYRRFVELTETQINQQNYQLCQKIRSQLQKILKVEPQWQFYDEQIEAKVQNQIKKQVRQGQTIQNDFEKIRFIYSTIIQCILKQIKQLLSLSTVEI